MGDHGAAAIAGTTDKASNKKQMNVLTHCNTGSLATAGYGTALGVIRALHSKDQLLHVYCTETRPYNQGNPSIHPLFEILDRKNSVTSFKMQG